MDSKHMKIKQRVIRFFISFLLSVNAAPESCHVLVGSAAMQQSAA